MANPRDPWLAANLSWSIAGLGNLYAGRKVSGWIFLALQLLGWTGWVAWILVPEISTRALVAICMGQVALGIVAAVLAFRAVRSEEPAPGDSKNPWKSLFLSRFIPGLGHLYARRWLRGLPIIVAFAVLCFWRAPERFQPWDTFGLYMACGVILADAFFILRRQNLVPRRTTLAALGLVLACSQGWVVAKLLQTFVAEVYRIPSSAMEPTLMGDVSEYHDRSHCPFGRYHQHSSGDRIVASKLAYLVSPIRRFDVAIFKFPLNQSKTFVKRVVGLPDEEIVIHEGDLFIRPKGESTFRIARKPLKVQDRLWIRTHDDDDAGNPATFRDLWKNTEGVTPGSDGLQWAETGKQITWIDFASPPDDSNGNAVGDLRLSFEVSLPGEADVIHARVENLYGTIELALSTAAGSTLMIRKPGRGDERIPLAEPLQRGRRCAVELQVFDGQAVALRDSTVLGKASIVDSLDDARAARGTKHGIALGVRGSGATVRRLQVSRDVHYLGRANRELSWSGTEPLKIPEGQYVMLGDNVSNSHDSRAWVKRTFVLKDGRKIVCESQQVHEGHSRLNRQLQEKLNLPEPPRYGIDGDEQGNEVAIPQEQFDHEEEPIPFRFVDRKFFTGRVLKIWWPLVREGPVR